MPRGDIHMTYYLCYGAPLMDRTLDRRVDSLRLEGQGRLDGWKLDFSREGGKPNLSPAPGAKTWGALYLIEKHKLEALDQAEAGAQRHEGKVYFEGHQEDCVFYTYPAAAGAPDKDFVEAFRSTYSQASLPQAQIDQALA